MQFYNFYKQHNKWYINLPDYPGNIEDLEMVLGADTLLDILSENTNTVDIILSLQPFEHSHELQFILDECNGGRYQVISNEHNFELWLCDVTTFVFGFLPKIIYIKKN